MTHSGEAYTADDVLRMISEDEGEEFAQALKADGRGQHGNDFWNQKKDREAVYKAGEEPGAQPLFHGYLETDLPKNFAVKHKSEKFEHRIVAYLKAQGHTNKKIAELTGYRPEYIGQLLRLPWVAEVISDEIKRSGRDAVQEVIQAATSDAVGLLSDTIRNEKAGLRERLSAANAILDRAFGKPNQPITHREEIDPTKLSDAELAKLATAGGRAN